MDDDHRPSASTVHGPPARRVRHVHGQRVGHAVDEDAGQVLVIWHDRPAPCWCPRELLAEPMEYSQTTARQIEEPAPPIPRPVVAHPGQLTFSLDSGPQPTPAA